MDIDLAVVGAIGAVLGFAIARIKRPRLRHSHRWVDDVAVKTDKGKVMRQNCADCPATRHKS